MRISSQDSSPEMMPLAITAMRPAWGAGSRSLPMPAFLVQAEPHLVLTVWVMSLECSRVMTATSTREALITPRIWPISMRQGVPPRLYPTLKSWAMSPATPATQQTTVATPSTARTPVFIFSDMVRPSSR